MKNFTNNFKQFTSRLSARWLIMALMLLVGTSSAWAIKIYFDNTNTNWSKVYLIVGHGSYSCFNNQMSVECGNIYSVDVNDWSNETQIAFHGGDSWGCEGNSISHRYGWHNGPFTHPYGITLNNASGKVFTPAATTSNIDTGNGPKKAHDWSGVAPYTFNKNTHCCSAPSSVSISRGNPTSGNICEDSTIDLTATVTDGSGTISYSWEKTSGGSDWSIANSTSQTCTVTAGTGNAEFKVTATRCGTPKTSTVTLTADPKSALTLKANPTICQGSSIVLSDYVESSTGTVKWYSNSGRTTEITNPSVARTPQSNPTYYYARATSGVCSSVDKTLTVTLSPQPAITLKADPTICNGTTVTFANYVNTSTGTVTWHTKSDFSDAAITTAKPSQTTTYYAKVSSGDCTPATASLKVTVNNKPAVPTLSADNTSLVAPNKATLTVGNTVSGLTYTLYNGEDAGESQTSTGSDLTFEAGEAGSYTVKVTNGCGTSTSTPAVEITVCTPQTNNEFKHANSSYSQLASQPTYYLGDKAYFKSTIDCCLTGSWTKSGDGTYKTLKGATPNFNLILSSVGSFTLTNNATDGCSGTTTPSISFTTEALPAPTDATASVTGNTANLLWTPGVRDSVLIVRYAKDATATAPTANTKYIVGNEIGNGMVVYKGTGTSFSNSGLTYGNAYDYYFYTVNNNYYSTTNNPKATVTVCPTAITGADNLFVNKTSEYTISATTGATYSWSIDTETDATIAGSGNTATVTAGATAGNATISVTISGGNCDGITLTKDITIKDGIVIYIRRPKSGDGTSVYSNWYNESSVKGGLPWVKQGPISGSNSDNQATTNNKGGTELTEAFTDCDGYTWDSFTPADSWPSFYLHALNDYKQDGWATFTKAINFDKSTDNYFYLSGWSSGNYGVTITKTNAPALGITIDALGSTEVISNNMASFAALYLKGNCSGKELKTDSEGDFTDQTFLWQYSIDGTSWSTYTGGDGATWNNIRPTQAGKYKLICTMEDDSQIESNIIEITTTTESYDADDLINIESSLPIFMVNTGGKGFPSCVNASDFPTKHADALKKKRSVDVKIKVGNDIVYDRKARMNYRGSSSLNFKKKSYAFSSGQEYCGLDKDESPDYMKKGKMDMFSVITNGAKTSSEEKDWVLYAANPDPSMMRNILAIDTYKAMTGEWGVQNQYVELYVDGVYQGVYVFLDKITQGKKRINVKWDVDDASKRGFILKFDKTDVADRYEDATGDQKTFESDLTGASGIGTYGTQVDQRFEIEYPEKGDIEDDGGSWAEVKGFIEAKVNAFESALKDGKFNEVRNMIDYQSWADFFIINEFVKNVDAYRASCIFVYEDNKLKAYPLWDYELSFNNQAIGSGKGKADPTGLLIEHDDVYSDAFAAPFWWTGRYSNHIYKGLLDDPCFVSMIKTRWDMHANGEGALTQSKLQDLVDSYTTALTTTDATGTYNSPKAREAKKWPYTYDSRGKADCNSGNTGYYAGWTSDKCEADMTALTTWIGSGDTGRRDNLDGIIEEMASDISFSLSVVSDKSTTTPWRPVIITVSSNSGYEYTITPEAAQVKDNGNQHTIYLARPEGTVGTNFATHAYTFTATSGETDQCGSSEPVSQSVQITLEDIEENCP